MRGFRDPKRIQARLSTANSSLNVLKRGIVLPSLPKIRPVFKEGSACYTTVTRTTERDKAVLRCMEGLGDIVSSSRIGGHVNTIEDASLGRRCRRRYIHEIKYRNHLAICIANGFTVDEHSIVEFSENGLLVHMASSSTARVEFPPTPTRFDGGGVGLFRVRLFNQVGSFFANHD
ncbi:hypothetical protein R69927_07724 [Paraburkholderia domus]|nr:hypothetical protein R69927_07724 [Paraburkholderia domus]